MISIVLLCNSTSTIKVFRARQSVCTPTWWHHELMDSIVLQFAIIHRSSYLVFNDSKRRVKMLWGITDMHQAVIVSDLCILLHIILCCYDRTNEFRVATTHRYVIHKWLYFCKELSLPWWYQHTNNCSEFLLVQHTVDFAIKENICF